jgi:hypothetical protein
MPRKSDVYPSKYFRASDYPDDWTQIVQVELVRLEEFHDNGKKTERPVAYFKGVKSGLVITPTKWDAIAAVVGDDDFVTWKGHVFQLYRDWTHMGGKRVPTIMVRAAPESGVKAKKVKSKKSDDNPDINDEIGF